LITFISVSAAIVFDNMIEEADFVLREYSRKLIYEFASEPPAPLVLEEQTYQVPLNAEQTTIRVLCFIGPGIDWRTQAEDWQFEGMDQMNWFPRMRTVWIGMNAWRTYSVVYESGYGIVLTMDLAEIKEEVWKMCQTYLSALPATLIIVGVGGWWMARRSVLPLRSLVESMESVAQGDLTKRVELTQAKDALDRLASVFNRMMTRLQSSFDQASRFSSDASHELRTPLTVLQGQLEEALQKAEVEEDAMRISGLLEQTERLRGIMDSLLLLSRSDAGKLNIESDEVDFSALTQEVMEDFEEAVADAGIRIEVDVKPGLRVRGDTGLLRQAIGNLLGNAIKYNLESEGWIEVKLTEQNGSVLLSLENSAHVIEADEREQIFRRFYRSAPGSGRQMTTVAGKGLGLSIVQAIAEAHHGSVWCEPGREQSNRFVFQLNHRASQGGVL